ncbi:ABC transporter ATP-binding protein [Dongia deserti]|uniref:ABC transporter ATP-binding protein n=1 Tax=Dongia deserti TaxID=2268030 RepID=UPI000E646A80|nr:ABC transporter ATP-binding protein [Dongia deserti]
MSEPALELRNVQQRFRQAGNGWLEVIKRADLQLRPGEMVALVGPSGSGKSTLLHICGLLEHQADGDVVIKATPTRALSDDKRTALRRTTMGFVYQYHHLLPEFSALENVVIPQMIAGKSRAEARTRATVLLKRVGLGERLDHRPAKLSGGEQQRVAIARALANGPAIVLADEPTGNLDMHTAEHVFDMLEHLVREDGVAALIATHNLEIARRMDRAVTIQDGVLVAA